MTIAVYPTTLPVGAELRGVDLNVDIDDQTFAAIRAAVDQYSLLVLRDQNLSNERHVAFTHRFGTLKSPRPESQWLVPGFPDITRMSNIIENGKALGLQEAGQYWHTDRVYEAVPNGYAFLRSIEIPHDDQGEPLGRTLFVSTAHAYETLPEDVKKKIAGLRATHHMSNRYGKHAKAYVSHEDHLPPVSHPVVRTHPVTGRKCLYVNEQYTVGIEGMAEPEARKLIAYLCAHITRKEFIYAHRWQVNDVLIWDDCAIQHQAIGDYQPHQRRLIQRTSVDGTVPV
jgi:taurine dioxygenase